MTDLIVALDYDTRQQAESLIDQLDGLVDFYKIGYQLFYNGDGLALGKSLLSAGKRVFFDLKLLDIDNTVAKGAAAIADTGASMLTVHAYPKVMRAALHATEGSGLALLGVSVLTGMTDLDLQEAGYSQDISTLVSVRAQQAKDIGIDGIVCSGFEAQLSRVILGPNPYIVSPGIRPKGSDLDDQRRVMTPLEAIHAGVSHIVVGRPIAKSFDPVSVTKQILSEIHP